jgi:hypothetical protein
MRLAMLPLSRKERPMNASPKNPEDLHRLAYEAHQQAARVRAVVCALADATPDADEPSRLCLEAVERLLDPVLDHLSTLDGELECLARPPKATEGAAE